MSESFSVTDKLRFTAIGKVAGPLIGACTAAANDGKPSLGASIRSLLQ